MRHAVARVVKGSSDIFLWPGQNVRVPLSIWRELPQRKSLIRARRHVKRDGADAPSR